MKIFNVLSLGAGVQSTALYLKFMRGEMPEKLDAAIFADTQDEPSAVYKHLDWLKSLGGPPILVRTIGRLSEHLISGRNGRFASIPAFTTDGHEVSKVKRQCSKEYKTEVIGKALRQDILGLAPGRSPKGVKVQQFIGISLDEAGRAKRMERNVPAPRYLRRRFPLIEQNLTRANLKTELAERVPHEVPRSACVFCPFHTDYEWNRIKTETPDEFEFACQVDRSLRTKGNIVNRQLDQNLYLHRACQPLDLIQFDPTPPPPRAAQLMLNFVEECEGVCGV